MAAGSCAASGSEVGVRASYVLSRPDPSMPQVARSRPELLIEDVRDVQVGADGSFLLADVDPEAALSTLSIEGDGMVASCARSLPRTVLQCSGGTPGRHRVRLRYLGEPGAFRVAHAIELELDAAGVGRARVRTRAAVPARLAHTNVSVVLAERGARRVLGAGRVDAGPGVVVIPLEDAWRAARLAAVAVVTPSEDGESVLAIEDTLVLVDGEPLAPGPVLISRSGRPPVTAEIGADGARLRLGPEPALRGRVQRWNHGERATYLVAVDNLGEVARTVEVELRLSPPEGRVLEAFPAPPRWADGVAILSLEVAPGTTARAGFQLDPP